MRHDRRVEFALALVAALILPAAASAQGFVEDRAAAEGPGFKTGRLVLHPGVSAEGGYTSNMFLQDRGQEDSFVLRVAGYLDVATEPPIRQREGEMNELDPQKLTFRGGMGFAYYQYFNDRIAPNAAADGHVDFAYNPSEVFSLQIRDQFIRTVRPFTNPNTLDGRATSYGRNTNNASVDFVGRSRGGVVEARIGYGNRFEFFDSDVFNYGNNISHLVPAQLSWSFFPSSALIYSVEYANRTYDGAITASPALLSDSNRVTNSVGYNGALTERFSLTAAIGYAAGFYDVGSNFDGVVARVEGRWKPRPTISLNSGYERTFRPSYIGNFTEMNRLFINTQFVLAGVFSLGIEGSVSFDKSGLALASDGTLLGNQLYRKDIRVLASIVGEYRFRAWLALIGRVSYLADFTDFRYVGAEPLLSPAASYQKFSVWLGLRLFY